MRSYSYLGVALDLSRTKAPSQKNDNTIPSLTRDLCDRRQKNYQMIHHSRRGPIAR